MPKNLLRVCCLNTLLLAACGGGGPASTTPIVNQAPPPNALAVAVDQGPPALVSQNEIAANTLYASVTFCTPGSTTACQTIDHLQVDTGSTGIRVIASALNGAANPARATDAASNPLAECTQFVDGYVWGSVRLADVELGGRKLASIPIQVIGDVAAGSAPSDCVSGPEEDTVAQFGANGLIGVGNFLQDCGSLCAAQVVPATYYACAGSVCTGTTVPLAGQVQNPVAQLASDNNGVVVQMPAVAPPGAATLGGTIYFGINTQADNALGAAKLFTLDGEGTFVTTFAGAALPSSFIDSGSNGYFFSTNSFPACSDAPSFYCPSAPVVESATITGVNGAAQAVGFSIGNADQLFNVDDTAYPDLGGTNGDFSGATGFDWGLPFFFGRSVYVLFEEQTLNGTAGPAVGF